MPAFAILARDQQKSDALSYSLPFEFAVLLDSSDAGKLMSSFDKLLQSLSALSSKGNVNWQSLSGLPYSVILIDDEPVLTYGVVDGRRRHRHRFRHAARHRQRRSSAARQRCHLQAGHRFAAGQSPEHRLPEPPAAVESDRGAG